MRSAVERSREYRKVVSAGVAASVAIHAAVLGLGRVHVELPGERPARERDARLAEPARVVRLVNVGPEAAVETAPRVVAPAAAAAAAAAPAEAAPLESFAVASEAPGVDAPPVEARALDLARPTPVRSLPMALDRSGRVVADEDVRATVPDVPVGTGSEEEEEGGGGLRGILDGIGGFLGGVKVSGTGAGGGTGGKGGCVPGIGGIIGDRVGGHSIPQRPPVGPRGVGGPGGRLQHRTGATAPRRGAAVGSPDLGSLLLRSPAPGARPINSSGARAFPA